MRRTDKHTGGKKKRVKRKKSTLTEWEHAALMNRLHTENAKTLSLLHGISPHWFYPRPNIFQLPPEAEKPRRVNQADRREEHFKVIRKLLDGTPELKENLTELKRQLIAKVPEQYRVTPRHVSRIISEYFGT